MLSGEIGRAEGPKFEEPATSKKGNDAGHGNRFQSKLLMLYAMRAINAGYQFYLGTELEDVAGKFDDLIFKYKDKNDASTGHYHYLQAKHKLNENDPKQQINAIQLLGTTKDKNFDLRKYFQSYVNIKSRGDDIEHCIICTNVDIDHLDLVKNDIILVGVKKGKKWSKILDCSDDKPQQTLYKFKVNDKLHNHMGNDPQVNDFFDKLTFSVKTPNEDELDLILTKEVGKYFMLSNATLPSAYVMNEMVNWFKKKENHWLTPEKAKGILIGKADEAMALSHTTSISLVYQKQLSKNLEFNDASIDQLMEDLNSFWDNSQVKILHISSKTPKLTAVKVLSAIKKMPDFQNKDDYLVISSQHLKEEKMQLEMTLKVKVCHHLLVLIDEDETKSLQVDHFYENLIHEEKGKKKIILISSQNFSKEKSVGDSITVGDLSETTKEFIKSKLVSFQGIPQTVGDLIDLRKANKAIDSNLIQNLLTYDEIIEIPSFHSSNFHDSLYIKRQVAFPSADELIKEIARRKEFLVKDFIDKCKFDSKGFKWHLQDNKEIVELWKDTAIVLKENNISDSSLLDSLEKIIKDKCQVDSNGRIQWFAKDEKEKEELWKDMAIILKESNMSDCLLLNTLSEERLIDPSNNKRVIITGVAGTGKSTILSHYYKEIKKKYSDWLAIKINLVDHTNAMVKIKSKEDASNFFINVTGINQNPFAQLLLKHRLEMGDRVVIMLDGFDEINEECQNKVVQLVKNLNESIQIYITTRSYMADQLQFELSQVAYSLVKFTEDDQIHYLTSIWKNYLKKKIELEEGTIRIFAIKLIERVAETLNDEEKEFIGIPLQCRILAECFLSKIITVKTINEFSHLLDSQQFDLSSVYKMMFEEKRRVFREEKIKFNSDDNHIAIESIDKSIRKTKLHLRKLAIQTIVDEKQYVEILNPPANFKSEMERKEKEKQLNESGIRYGLLCKQHEGNVVQFLHRTYAEYLVADYIYNGFLLDEERHNKLLENESVMNWIVEKLLVEDKYNGVRVFFDSMLKEIIDHEEWKNRIKQPSSLPERLEKFVCLLFDRDDNLYDFLGYERETRNFQMVFEGRNANILLFILDCLTVQLTPSEMQSVVINVIVNPFNQKNNVFQRILNYFNDADDHQLEKILETLCKHQFWRRATALEVKQENVKRNVVHFLDFMDSHREKVKFVLDEEHRVRYGDMRVFFIHHGCDDLIKRYFTLVSSAYSDDFDFAKFMKKIIHEYHRREDWQIGQIEKTLIVLRDLSRPTVLLQLSRYILLSDSEKLQQDENLNFRLWLEEMGITGLHRVCQGDPSSIEKIIGYSIENPKILRLMINENDIVPPFYVSAAYGHDEICRKIIKFLPYMTDKGKCINKLFTDAIQNYNNALMVRTILKSVKAVWGQNYLIQLLKPVFCFDEFYFRGGPGKNKQIFVTLISIVVEDRENGYRDLNDLVFQDRDSIQTLEHVPCDILQGMITATGRFEDWMNRLMNTDIKRAFDVLSSYGFLDKLDQEHHIPKLIDILTKQEIKGGYWLYFKHKMRSLFFPLETKREKVMSNSYWSEYAKDPYAENFLKVVVKQFGEEDLKRLLFSRDENNIVIIFRLLIRKNWFETKLFNLPEKLKKEIQDLFKEETPQLVDYLFSSTFFATLRRRELLNAIEYYLKNGNEKQLSKFSQVVNVHQLEEALQFAKYVEGERCKEFAKLLETKLDNKTKRIYDSLIEEFSN